MPLLVPQVTGILTLFKNVTNLGSDTCSHIDVELLLLIPAPMINDRGHRELKLLRAAELKLMHLSTQINYDIGDIWGSQEFLGLDSRDCQMCM
jgi:hypothetical protein